MSEAKGIEGGYRKLPKSLQELLKQRFATAIQQSTLSSKARDDKKKAHDLFSILKKELQQENELEEYIEKHGFVPDLVASAVPSIEEGGEEGGEEGSVVEQKEQDQRVGARNGREREGGSIPESRNLVLINQHLTFSRQSLIPLLRKVVGHLYLISREYGVCADHVLHTLDEKMGASEGAMKDTVRVIDDLEEDRDYWAKETASLANVVKVMCKQQLVEDKYSRSRRSGGDGRRTGRRKRASSPSSHIQRSDGSDAGSSSGDDYDEDEEYEDDEHDSGVEGGGSGSLTLDGHASIDSTKSKKEGQLDAAKRLTERTQGVVAAFMQSADEMAKRVDQRRKHEAKVEREITEARLQQAREDYLAQGRSKKMVRHRGDKGGSKKGNGKVTDFRERRKQEEIARKREREHLKQKGLLHFTSDRGEEHDREEAALAVMMLEDQIRILEAQLEVARFNALSRKEQQEQLEEKERKMEEMRTRVERAKAMSSLKFKVISQLRQFISRWRRARKRRRSAALRILVWWRFYEFLKRVRFRVRTRETAEYLAYTCFIRVIKPRRELIAAALKVQRFFRGSRFKWLIRNMFNKIVHASLEKSALAVKRRLDPLAEQIRFMEGHLLDLAPDSQHSLMQTQLSALRAAAAASSSHTPPSYLSLSLASGRDTGGMVGKAKSKKKSGKTGHGGTSPAADSQSRALRGATREPLDDTVYDDVPISGTGRDSKEARQRRKQKLWRAVQVIWRDAGSLKERLLLVQSRTQLLRIAERTALRLQYLEEGRDHPEEVDMPPLPVSAPASVVLVSEHPSAEPSAVSEGDDDSSAGELPSASSTDSYYHNGPLNGQIFPLYHPQQQQPEGHRSPRPIEMIGGDDGEDDEAVTAGGTRYRQMLARGAKIPKEALVAKLLRLQRKAGAHQQSLQDKQARALLQEQERSFVVRHFAAPPSRSRDDRDGTAAASDSKGVPVSVSPTAAWQRLVPAPAAPAPAVAPEAEAEAETEAETETETKAEAEGEEQEEPVPEALLHLVGDLLLPRESPDSLRASLVAARKAEAVSNRGSHDAQWPALSQFLTLNIARVAARMGIYPRSGLGTANGDADSGLAIPPLGYVPDLRRELPSDVFQALLLLQSGRSPAAVPLGRGGLGLFSKDDLGAPPRPAIPPRESRDNLVSSTLQDAMRHEAVHHASELALSGALQLECGSGGGSGGIGGGDAGASLAGLMTLAARGFGSQAPVPSASASHDDTVGLLRRLVKSLNTGCLSFLRDNAGSVPLPSKTRLLALLGHFASSSPPALDTWLTNTEGRLAHGNCEQAGSPRVMAASGGGGGHDLADCLDGPTDAGAATVFLSYAWSLSLGHSGSGSGSSGGDFITLARALECLQLLFGLKGGELRSSGSLLRCLSLHAHTPRSAWHRDTEFAAAVSVLLRQAGIDIYERDSQEAPASAKKARGGGGGVVSSDEATRAWALRTHGLSAGGDDDDDSTAHVARPPGSEAPSALGGFRRSHSHSHSHSHSRGKVSVGLLSRGLEEETEVRGEHIRNEISAQHDVRRRTKDILRGLDINHEPSGREGGEGGPGPSRSHEEAEAEAEPPASVPEEDESGSSDLRRAMLALQTRRAAFLGGEDCEEQREGLLLPAGVKHRSSGKRDTTIRYGDEFGLVHSFDSADYAALQGDLDFSYYVTAQQRAQAMASKEGKGKQEGAAAEEHHLVVVDPALYAGKCSESYGQEVQVGVAKDQKTGGDSGSWFKPYSRRSEEPEPAPDPPSQAEGVVGTKEAAREEDEGEGELTLFEAQQRRKLKAGGKKKGSGVRGTKTKASRKSKRSHAISTGTREEGEGEDEYEGEGKGDGGGGEEAGRISIAVAKAPQQVRGGQFVENESFFLGTATVDRCAFILALLPLHLRQRRRMQRMIWLNEKWRCAEGHTTGVLPAEHFRDTVIDSLLATFPTQSVAATSERIQDTWNMVVKGQDVIKSVDSAMDFEAFCQAIEILFQPQKV